jgi:predicted nucleotidyltransferase
VLRDDFSADSDVDFLVTFAPDCRLGLLGWSRIQNELKVLLNREVDWVSRWSIEKSDNWIRRQNILGAAEVIYVA